MSVSYNYIFLFSGQLLSAKQKNHFNIKILIFLLTEIKLLVIKVF